MTMMKSTKLASWRNRNNSANISAILQPNYFQNHQSYQTSSTTLLEENRVKTSNFCYCRKLPNYVGNNDSVDGDDDKPKLFQHPLEFYQNRHQLSQQEDYNDKNNNNNNSNSDDDDDDDNESPRKSLNLRLDLDDFKESRRDSVKKSLNNHKSNDNHRYLDDLETWRQSHYFDTHSINHLLEKKQQQQQKQKQHTCIHRFKLNHRNLPVAINTDRHGLSCCIICKRPMRNYRISYNNNDDDDDDDKSPIYLQNDDDVEIQLVLNDDDNNNDCCDKERLIRPTTIDYLNKQFERPVYSNTLALRYQKGVALP